ncbi:hypothetical protein, partial [Neisseria sp. P0018.S002]|uniref:hypothetical protein n=1 Tax=Neisseria sp. P0018.S002 TaxID=3436788 RepID=UPI003F7F40F0
MCIIDSSCEAEDCLTIALLMLVSRGGLSDSLTRWFVWLWGVLVCVVWLLFLVFWVCVGLFVLLVLLVGWGLSCLAVCWGLVLFLLLLVCVGLLVLVVFSKFCMGAGSVFAAYWLLVRLACVRLSSLPGFAVGWLGCFRLGLGWLGCGLCGCGLFGLR